MGELVYAPSAGQDCQRGGRGIFSSQRCGGTCFSERFGFASINTWGGKPFEVDRSRERTRRRASHCTENSHVGSGSSTAVARETVRNLNTPANASFPGRKPAAIYCSYPIRRTPGGFEEPVLPVAIVAKAFGQAEAGGIEVKFPSAEPWKITRCNRTRRAVAAQVYASTARGSYVTE